ncbi:MAG: serine O-acetyltransferase [Pseudomonadales bacterium]|nr:serine O-acetyltransferase [Pseudomonadales bacterium]
MEQVALWQRIREEVELEAAKEPILASFLHATILNHNNLPAALSFHLANKLESATLSAMGIREIFEKAYDQDSGIIEATCRDIAAVVERDPVCSSYSIPLLYFKGFHALQAYRVSHWLWAQNRQCLALFMQNQISVVFGVDIHPAARIGSGILVDHATGIVVGETAVIEDDVSILQSVTLGGTGKESGDRHPKIRRGVLISAGAKVLGNVEVGEGAKVGAGSVVLKPVPPHTTVAGVPAMVIGKPHSAQPALDMNQDLGD